MWRRCHWGWSRFWAANLGRVVVSADLLFSKFPKSFMREPFFVRLPRARHLLDLLLLTGTVLPGYRGRPQGLGM